MTPSDESYAKPDFFISRAGADKDFAEVISHILENTGYRVIVQQWDFRNRNFMQQMHAALNSGARVIALLSPDYLNSDHCLAEALNTIAHDPLNKKGRLIVLRVAECVPDGIFTALAYWDLLSIRGHMPIVRDIVLTAVKEGRHNSIMDPRSPYWRSPRLTVHDHVRVVPNFAGRRQDLAGLCHALWMNGHAGSTPLVALTHAAVHGLGGVGKSVLAVQYGWEMREHYAGVWWVNAETQSGIVDGLVELGSRFIRGLEQTSDRTEAARATLRLLCEGGFEKPWLLIYDNVEQPKALDGLVPISGCQLLITSRWADWIGRAVTFTLGVFEEDEAVDFLLRRTGSMDSEGAAMLAAALGYLPLALDHAAAYCLRAGITFDVYQSYLSQLIREAPKGVDYPLSIYATFNLAIARAVTECPEVERLTSVIAFLFSEEIPLDIVPYEVISELSRNNAVAALTEVSLVTIKVSGERAATIGVHRLVQEVMRGRLAERDELDSALTTAIAFINDSFPIGGDDARFWPRAERLVPHAIAVLNHASSNTWPIAEQVIQLCNKVAVYFGARAQFADSEQLYARTLAVFEEQPSLRKEYEGTTLNNLGWLRHQQGRYPEAEALLTRALALREQSSGLDHLAVAATLNNLGWLYYLQSRYGEAEPLYKRALAIRENVLSPIHLNVADSLNDLAALYYQQGLYENAEPLFQRALSIFEELLGPDHPFVATSTNNLAMLYRAKGRYVEAEPLLLRTISVREKALGLYHPDFGQALNNLAWLYLAQERIADIEHLLKQALVIRESSLGSKHPDVAQTLHNLARLCIIERRFDEAEAHLDRATFIIREALGDSHPDLGGLFASFAELDRNRGDYARAEQLLDNSLKIIKEALGFEHLEVAKALNDRGRLYHCQGRISEAEEVCDRALSICDRTVGINHPVTSHILANLAEIRLKLGRNLAAEQLYRQAVAACEVAFGADHHVTKKYKVRLAAIIEEQGRSSLPC